MIKDYSTYSFTELYDMLDHIDYEKHPDKLEAIEKEIQKRKLLGELPDVMVPAINWHDLRFWKKADHLQKEAL